MNEIALDNLPNLGLESKPSLKLIKNSKGYGWEIKQLTLDVDELEQLNNKMMEKFGSLE